ncbi:MAG: Asp-tRNA(Asn)/Glu-tRNA(Gln) amidotransferase subunit GatC [Candidatus Pacebacteria bacterium]|nr:Asp-tRNA(Asn)/Glu-tRNA(Gln) amidotransferase subunit GatC [Candidatus Paceibacterota bacterium]
MSEINKKELEHLAELARLELPEKQEKKFVEDLGKILDYFKELQEVNTDKIEPMIGGFELNSISREDVAGQTDDTGKGSDSFPDQKDGFLKVPPVF